MPLLSPTPTLEPLTSSQREELFEQIWGDVNENYVYTDFRGLDWKGIHDEYLPKVQAASDEEFYGIMVELINKLGDDHSRYETPQDVAEEQARFEGELSYVGIGAVVRSVPEGGLITRLAKDGPAEQAGILTRDLILKVGGIPFTDTEKFGPRGPIGLIRGGAGVITLTVRTGDQRARDVQVNRRVVPNNAFPNVEAYRLPDSNIAYLLIDTFSLVDLDKLVEQSLRDLLNTGPIDGLIIDVRDNSGGQINLMLNTIGLFVDGGSIGRSEGRSARYGLDVPRNRVIDELDQVPIAVLIGEDTVSAGEIFASGMQTLKRATIVGVPSAGNTENLLAKDFFDGSRLWLAELVFYRPDGRTIEGKGVQPDVPIKAEWWRYNIPDDPQVLAAVAALKKK